MKRYFIGLTTLFFGLLLIPMKANDSQASAPLVQFLTQAGFDAPASHASSTPTAPVELVSAKQDFKHLTFDQACHTLTPLKIGDESFPKGLGMHANGNVVYKLNGSFTRFIAHVGIDNNSDTAGGKGSAAFAVKVDGTEVTHTPVCKGGEASVSIDVPLKDAKQLELVVTDGGDGIAYDQSDWGDAHLVDATGKTVYLSDFQGNGGGGDLGFLRQHQIPASFTYGGESSATLLTSWTKELKSPVEQGDRTIYECSWREPNGGLVATWRAEVFHDWPAMEFKWTFRNEGKEASKPLTNVNALDLNAGLGASAFHVFSSTGGNPRGDIADPNLGFSLHDFPGGVTTLTSGGGRSSGRDLPFFLVHSDDPAEGVFVGIGWSGSWKAVIDGSNMKDGLHITAQMPDMNLALPPGEEIRSPSILLGTYKGDKSVGSNTLRRLLYAKYTPLLNGEKPLPPVSWNHWFFFQNAISETMMEGQADVAAKAGIEYFCIDAGWFEGGFPDGVGNWLVDKNKFPGGLGPIGSYVNKKGMKLGLWFEPERVGANTRITKEHPEWIIGNLVNLGNKDARNWIFNMMKGFIDEGHVRWIRWDFNTEPLGAWNSADAADQHGLTQIRYIEGLYDLLDRIMKAYPDLLIEGCASGGNRIDLETIKRSHTFWKSDNTGVLADMRFHETGGNTFLPAGLLNTNLLVRDLPFDTQSIFGGAFGLQCDWTKLDARTLEQLTEQIALYKQLRPLLNENYYPIFPQSHELTGWVGWQFDSPSQEAGFIVVLRPGESPYNSSDISLQGLDPSATYTLTPLEGAAGTPGEARKLTGAELAKPWTVELKSTSGIIYKYSKNK